MIRSPFRARFAGLALVVLPAVLAAAQGLAQPLPMRPKVKAGVESVGWRMCGQPFNVRANVKSEVAKLDGRIDFRGVSTPITVAKDAIESVTAAGGVLDCSKDLAATFQIHDAGGAAAKDFPLFSTKVEPKSVSFKGFKIPLAPYGGYVALSIADTACGSVIQGKIMNMLESKGGAPGPTLKLIASGNGVTRTAGALGASAVELGVLDCSKGAPSFTLSGQGLAPVTIAPETVTF